MWSSRALRSSAPVNFTQNTPRTLSEMPLRTRLFTKSLSFCISSHFFSRSTSRSRCAGVMTGAAVDSERFRVVESLGEAASAIVGILSS